LLAQVESETAKSWCKL